MTGIQLRVAMGGPGTGEPSSCSADSGLSATVVTREAVLWGCVIVGVVAINNMRRHVPV